MRFFRLQKIALVFVLVPVGFTLGLLPNGLTASAQGIITGGISGTVTDQTSAAIPNAIITAQSETTGAKLTTKSDAQGAFSIPDVPIGSYTVTITADGFGQGTTSHVQVISGNTTSMGKKPLALGSASQTVEVEAGAAQLINTESSQGELSIESSQLATIPVSGAIDNVTLMVPGVVAAHADNFSNTNGVNFSVNGERGRSNNSEIDGQTNNDDSIGGPSFFFSNQDALQEVQVITTDMGAQYGRNFGSIVNYITKQGTNTFHGSAFEYYIGSWGSSLTQYQKDEQFNFCAPGTTVAQANNLGCNLVSVPRFVENLYGGTLGGPVLKNKLFLFGSTFWAHEYQAGATDTSGGAVFPDANGLKQLQSAYPNNPAVAAMAMDGPFSLSNGNPSSFAPTTVPVTDGNTITNVEMAQYSRSLTEHVLDQEELGRMDYQMTPKDRFYLRYAYQNNPWVPAWYLYFPTGVAAGGIAQVSGIAHEVGADWTHTFTTNMTNQLRYAFQQTKIGFYGGSEPTCTPTDFTPCSSMVTIGGIGGGFGYGYGSLFGGGADFPQGRVIKVNQVQDNAQWTHGRHTILFGMEYDFQNSPWGYLPDATGAYNFTPGTATNATYPNGIPLRNVSSNPGLVNGYTGMLEGIGQLSLAQGNTTIPFREPDLSFYFQDNFRVMPTLTLNLGLRYEYFGQSVNQIHNQSVAQQTGPHPFWNTSLPLSATTFPSIAADYRNIEPRIGLAYTPSYLPKMVVHAGFSINVDPVFYNIFLNIAAAAPVVNSGVINCDGVTVKCEPSGGFSYATVQAAEDSLLPTGGDPRLNPVDTVPTNLRNPMAETYTLGIQYQVAPAAVAEVRYVGNHSFGLFQSLNANPDVLNVQSAFANYGAGTAACTSPTATGYTRPNCNYFLIDEVGNTAFSIYNALQTSLTVRDFHHWTGTASYTYSRTIDNVSEINSTGSGGTTSAYAQDPLNTDVGERGVSGNSYPSVWGIQLTYTEPWFHEQHGIIGRVLGGYFLNSFYQYNGGQPFNPIQNASTVGSPCVQADITDTPATPPTSCVYTPSPASINPTTAESSFCDAAFAGYYGNPCRPVLSNPKAPMNSVGINLGPGGYVDYVTGAPTTPTAEHWLWNNQYQALALKNPFPGVGRNVLRGDSWNDWDASFGKNFKTTERVTVQLTINVFNVLNRAFYGVPDPNVEDSWALGAFLSNYYAFNTSPGTAAGGGAYYAGFGNRNIQLSAHVNF